MNRLFIRLILAALVCSAVASRTCADAYQQDFNDWTAQTQPGTYSNEGWVATSAILFNASVFSGLSNTLSVSIGDDGGYILTPLLTNGVGDITYWYKAAFGNAHVHQVQYSSDLSVWSDLAVRTNASADWAQDTVPAALYSPLYLRIRKDNDGGASSGWLGVDSIAIDLPAADVWFTDTSTDPEQVNVGRAVDIRSTLTEKAGATITAVKTWWRVGSSGPFTAIAMSDTGGGVYETDTSIPALGTPGSIEYYVEATFTGYKSGSTSPAYDPEAGSGGPYDYEVLPKDVETSSEWIRVIGDASTKMYVIGDYTWQGVAEITGVTDADVAFQGLSTNLTTTNYWRDSAQTHTDLPIMDTADTTATDIRIGGTYSGQLAFVFNESNLLYSIRACTYNDFADWLIDGGYASDTNDGWVAINAEIKTDNDRKLRDRGCYLNGTGTSYIRTAYISNGIGQVSFSYRNFESDGSPLTRCYIQKSKTGGSDPSEWTTIDSIDSIINTKYARYTNTFNDRYYPYVRILNSTNDAHAGLCIDEFLVAQAGAGVVMQDESTDPAEPIFTDTVALSVDVYEQARASNLTMTAYYRRKSDGLFESIPMTNTAGNSWTTITNMPAGQGEGDGGAGPVDYYFSCSFDGYQSDLATPIVYPEGAPASHLSFTIDPASVVYSNVVTDPAQPLAGSSAHVEADIIPIAGAHTLSVVLHYRIGQSGGWTDVAMNNTVGDTFRTSSAIPAQAVPGTMCQYYITTTFQGPSASPTEYPAAGASDPAYFLFRAPAPTSSYTSMSITGDIAGPLALVDNSTWAGVINVGSVSAANWLFSGVNGGTTTWGDVDATRTALPLFGTANTGSDDMQISGTTTGTLAFFFNESTLGYDAQQCIEQNFDAWTTAAAFDTYASGGWTIEDGRTTQAGEPDASRTYSGKSLFLDGSANAQYIESPYLGAGVGDISFMYRNGSSNGVPDAGFSVQVSDDGSSWTTVTNVGGILSVDYLYFRCSVSDPGRHYVRVVNTTDSPHAVLCIDSLVITEPGAYVTMANDTSIPAAPKATETVDLSVEVTERSSASVSAVTAYYRSRSSGQFVALSMTNAGGNVYQTSVSVPQAQGTGPGGSGDVDYYFSCSFTGFRSEFGSPIEYPRGGSSNPNTFTVQPASVAVSNVTTVPAQPVQDDVIHVQADIQPLGGATDVTPTLYYREGSSGGWTALSMSVTTGNTFTTDAALDVPMISGLRGQYYLYITFSGPAASPTEYPAGGASNPIDFVIRGPNLESLYSGMAVTGDYNKTLRLIGDNVWHGIYEAGAPVVDGDFLFQATGGGNPTWGDTDQTITNLPVFGVAETGTDNILLSGTVSSNLAYRFNETNGEYSAQNCAYLKLDDWWTGASYGDYTSPNGWYVKQGRTTDTADADDNARVFDGTRSLYLDGAAGADQYVMSPRMNKGVGEVGFHYRSWETNGDPTVSFEVQVSPDGVAGWITVGVVTNIVTFDYLHYSVLLSDLDNHYARIISRPTTAHAQLCLDELFVCEPGPGVTITGVTNSPSSPTLVDTVTITADIAERGNASGVEATLWFRAGTSGGYTPVAMSNTVGHTFEVVAPAGGVGTMQYYIEATFFGLNTSQRGSQKYPSDYTQNPLSYEVTDFAWAEDFDDWTWTTAAENTTNDGWIAKQAFISGISIFAGKDGTTAAWLDNSNAYIQTPLLSNGVVNVLFYCKNFQSSSTDFSLDYSTDGGTTWVTAVSYAHTDDSTWSPYVTELDVDQPVILRISLNNFAPDSVPKFGVDSIAVSRPPARVTISDVVTHPGYPAPSDAVDVACTIDSGGPVFPALAITARVYWREQGAGSYSGPIQMTRSGNRYTTSSKIPAKAGGTVIEYYIESTFQGYANSAQVSRSPSFYPDGVPLAQTDQYFGPPTTPVSYTVRRHASEYGRIDISANAGTTEMELVGDNEWRGLLDVSEFSSNKLTWTFTAIDHYTGTGSSSYGDPESFGDSQQVRFSLPLTGNADSGGTNMYAIGPFSGSLIFLYNTVDNSYTVLRGVYQHFNSWLADPDLFEQSLDTSELHIDTTGFENWAVNQDYATQFERDTERFEEYDGNPELGIGWEVGNYYPTRSTDSKVGWFVDDATIIEEIDPNDGIGNRNEAARLDAIVGAGNVWQHITTTLDGIGTFSFDYRVMLEDHAHTWYRPSSNMLNYSVEADVSVRQPGGIPQHSPGYAYLSVLTRYQDADNYYEYRIKRKELGEVWLQSRRKASGVNSQINAQSWGVALENADSVKVYVCDNNGGRVYCEAGLYNGSSWKWNSGGNYYDSSGSKILQPGAVGFLTSEADIRVDNVKIRQVRIQRFEHWSQGSVGDYTSAGWTIDRGRPTGDYCYMPLYNSVEYSTVTSPTLNFPDGNGTVRFTHRRTNGTNGTVRLQGKLKSNSQWSTIVNVPVTSSGAQTYTRTVDFQYYSQLRIQNISPISVVRLEDIYVESSAVHNEQFSSSGNPAGWSDPDDKWAASGGVYERDGYVGPDVSFRLEMAPTNGPSITEFGPADENEWVQIPGATWTDRNLRYKHVDFVVTNAQPSFVRIRHTDGAGSLVVDNCAMTSWHAKFNEDGSNGVADANEWIATESWVQNSGAQGRTVQLSRNRAVPNVDQFVRGPLLSNGLGQVEFLCKTQNGSSTFVVEASTLGAPSIYNLKIATNTISNTGWQRKSYSVKQSDVAYCRVRNVSPVWNRILHLDDFRLSEYRERNNATWFAYNALITDGQDGREWEPGADVKTCYLNDSFTDGTGGVTLDEDEPYIETPILSNGIGEVSFQFRAWDSSPDARIAIRTATDTAVPASNWTLRAQFNVDNTSYEYFKTNFYITDHKFLRIYSDLPAERVCLDNVLITEAIGADLDVIAVELMPEVPLPTTDPVGVEVTLGNFLLQPSNRQVRIYYKLGADDWGTWTNSSSRSFILEQDLGASDASKDVFRTLPGAGFPQCGVDTVVQYRVHCTFEGPFAGQASPAGYDAFQVPSYYYPTDLNAGKPNKNPYYVVFSCLPGDVWINEFNYYGPWFGYPGDFVEVAGKAGSDIRNWQVELVNPNTMAVYGAYTNTSIPVVLNETNGFGFWVVGDSPGVANVDDPFTHTKPDGLYSMFHPEGGIRLVRSMGAWAHAVWYGDTAPEHYQYAATKQTGFVNDSPVYMDGTGSNRTDFTWQYSIGSAFTPGAINPGQVFSGGGNGPPPDIDVDIDAFWPSGAKFWLRAAGDPGGSPVVWYTSNLLDTSSWAVYPDADAPTYNGGYYTISFDAPTGTPPWFFRIGDPE